MPAEPLPLPLPSRSTRDPGKDILKEAKSKPKSSFDPSVITDALVNLEEVQKPLTYNDFMPGGSVDMQIWEPNALYEPFGQSKQDEVLDAKAAVGDALRDQREAALKVDPSVTVKPRSIKSQTYKMTPEDYAALSPLQQAAVNFNTSLARAARRDRRHQDDYKPTEDQRAVYAESVANMFGEGRGDVRYAPETLALLRQIGFDDPNADLTDFLNLDAAVTTKDLKDVVQTRAHQAELPAGAEGDRIALSRDLAGDTMRMQESLAQGNALLQSMNATAVADRNPEVSRFGGIAAAPNTSLGYGSGSLDLTFQDAFDVLASKGSDEQGLLTKLNSMVTPEQYQQFLEYANTRSANAAAHGLDLGQNEGVKYKTPEEFRKLLGMDGGSGG